LQNRIITNLDEDYTQAFALKLIIWCDAGLCIIVALFTAALLILHTYLASKNLSSWEYFSWMKITYMKIWPRKYGSPFA